MSSSDPGSVELDNIKDATLDMNVCVKGRVCNISKGSFLHGMCIRCLQNYMLFFSPADATVSALKRYLA